MALGLVARSAVAVADSINAFYRVLKGTDPDNVYVRLPTAGSFEVRHSVTNAPVLRITDAGFDGALITDGTVSSAEIAPNTIVDADISPTAAMQVTKLAHVGPNNVLRSNGTQNVGGPVVTNDMVINTINGNRILDNSILGAKISGGAPPPGGVGVADAYKVYATAAAGTTVSLQQVVTQMLAANAVTKVTSSPALATAACVSPTVVNLYDLTVVSSGGVLLAFLLGYAHNNTAAASTSLGINLDGGGYQAAAGWHQPAASPGYDQGFSGLIHLGTPSAGTHHVVAQWVVSGGQTNITAGFLIVVEFLR